ncbi:MAG TPA: hypothetical protein EYN06_06335, partial [Myxococcales bacterium]|nr:hypothetical protein [Myxococcales bacterium]
MPSLRIRTPPLTSAGASLSASSSDGTGARALSELSSIFVSSDSSISAIETLRASAGTTDSNATSGLLGAEMSRVSSALLFWVRKTPVTATTRTNMAVAMDGRISQLAIRSQMGACSGVLIANRDSRRRFCMSAAGASCGGMARWIMARVDWNSCTFPRRTQKKAKAKSAETSKKAAKSSKKAT